jgi:hypothetical protein
LGGRLAFLLADCGARSVRPQVVLHFLAVFFSTDALAGN